MPENSEATGTCTLPAAPGAELQQKAADFARGARAQSTLRAYATDWRDWETWCANHELCSLPAAPATVGLYLADRAATLKVSTLRRRVTVIGQAHRVAKHPLDTKDPAIREVFAGIRRAIGAARRPKAALVTPDLRLVLKALPNDLAGVRDRAMLLLGFAAALRRSELVDLDVNMVRFTSKGLAVSIEKSKTDQEGEGALIGVLKGKHDCPVSALERWLERSKITSGALFRAIDRHGRLGERLSGAAVAEIVKRAVIRAGLDPKRYAGHSLRRGFCTSAIDGGADLAGVARHVRHRRISTTMLYVEKTELYDAGTSKSVGL